MSAAAPTVLARILQSTRRALAERKQACPPAALQRRAEERARAGGTSKRRFRDAIARPPLGIVAEFKRRSPSAGVLRARPDLAAIVRAYEQGGACALSVLTEEANFQGSLADLELAREHSTLPVLRKDFIVDAYQLHEALLAGADAVLLIVAALSGSELCELHGQARALGLDALVEVHERDELAAALAAGADLIGINNRDLRDFSVDVRRTSRLLEGMPPGVSVISESGVAEPAQVRALADEGVHAVLIGEALMRCADPGALLGSLLRAAAQPAASGKI